jgi:hypothetical protein
VDGSLSDDDDDEEFVATVVDDPVDFVRWTGNADENDDGTAPRRENTTNLVGVPAIDDNMSLTNQVSVSAEASVRGSDSGAICFNVPMLN